MTLLTPRNWLGVGREGPSQAPVLEDLVIGSPFLTSLHAGPPGSEKPSGPQGPEASGLMWAFSWEIGPAYPVCQYAAPGTLRLGIGKEA